MGHTSLWYFPPNLGRWRLGCAAPFHRYGPFLKALLRLLRSLPNPQFRQSPDCTATHRPVEVDHAGAGHFCACRKKPAHTNVKDSSCFAAPSAHLAEAPCDSLVSCPPFPALFSYFHPQLY